MLGNMQNRKFTQLTKTFVKVSFSILISQDLCQDGLSELI